MSELWDNPLYPLEERLEMAKGGIAFRDKIIANLRDQLEQARAGDAAGKDSVDAARYRWLREQYWNEADMAVVCDPKKSVKLGFDCPSGKRLDEAIDSAIASSTRQCMRDAHRAAIASLTKTADGEKT